MHGTGTTAGDSAEMEAVTTVFGNRPKDNPLFVGAVKASIGHGGAAAGVASMIKAVEMLRRRTIPRQPGFPRPKDPSFEYIDKMNIRIPEASLPFTTPARPFSKDGKGKILVNNFDASGGNNCVLLEEAPAGEGPSSPDPRGYYTVAVSARTSSSLKKNMERLLSFVQKNPDIPVASIAYTSTARRVHEDLKKAYTVNSTEKLMTLLRADIKKDLSQILPSSAQSVVFAFTGQGSQHLGMGKQLFDTCQKFRDSVLTLHEHAKWRGFPGFLGIISDDQSELEAYDPVQIQLSLVVLEMSLANLWKSWGVEPSLVVGYSLGEYVALYVSGVLSAQDVLFLVGNRAQLMNERCKPGSYAMLAAQASPRDLEQTLTAYPGCEVACLGAPRSTVVSGPTEDVVQLHAELKKKSLSCTLLNVPYGFHCAQVDPILEDYRELAERVLFSKPRIPVASSLDGAIVAREDIFSPSYLVRQTREPVNFIGALKAAEESKLVDKTSLWIEIGPKVLNSLVKATLSVEQSKLLQTMDDKHSNWETLTDSLTSSWQEGVAIKWPKFHRHFSESLRLVDLPTYAFDLRDYWIQPALPVQPGQAPPLGAPSLPVIAAVPGFPTAILQRVHSEKVNGDEVSVTFESAMSHPAIVSIIKAHRVSGVDLFPASGWIDVAFTAAKYVHHRTKENSPIPSLSMSDLSISHPLTLGGNQSQQHFIVAIAIKKAGSPVVDVSFKSREGNVDKDHGSCKIRFEAKAVWESEWSQVSHFINAAKNNVISNSTRGGHRLPKPIVYKLFSEFVNYTGDFKGIEEVYLNSDFKREAVSNSVLPDGSPSNFFVNPYWSDTVIQICGFFLHSDPDLPQNDCFLFNGLEEYRLLIDSLKPGVTFSSYTYIRNPEKQGIGCPRHVLGDVYIFQGDKMVGIAKGMAFQRMTKRALTTVLGKGKQGTPHTPQGTAMDRVIGTPTPCVAAVKPATPKPGNRNPSVVGTNTADVVIAHILVKVGTDQSLVAPTATLIELDLDSLEWIELVGVFKNTLNIEIPASFHFQHPKAVDMRRAIAELSLEDSERIESDKLPDAGVVTITSKQGGETSSSGGYADIVLDTVVAQTGCDRAEITSSTYFDDLGLDSLCTMEVVGIVREQTGLDLPASFFHHHPTVADVCKALGSHDSELKPVEIKVENPGVPALIYGEPVMIDIQAETPSGLATPADMDISTPMEEDVDDYHCDFFLMQGSSDSTEIPMFFLPDGTGYPAVLLKLPPVFKGDNPLFTCKSPLLHKAEEREVSCTIEGLAGSYAAAVRRTRPHGPYLLAGYSLGAAYAFEVAKILADAGEVVQGLLFVDFNMAASVGLEHRKRKPVPSNLNVGMMEQVGWMNGISNKEKNFYIPPAPSKIKFHALSIRQKSRASEG